MAREQLKEELENKLKNISEEDLRKVVGGNGAPDDIIECPSCGFPDEAWSWYSGSGECPNCGAQVIQ